MTLKTTNEVTVGDILEMSIVASHKTSIIIEITNFDGDMIQELSCTTTKEFKCETFWSIPKDIIPGTYMIKANDSISSSETTIEVIPK